MRVCVYFRNPRPSLFDMPIGGIEAALYRHFGMRRSPDHLIIFSARHSSPWGPMPTIPSRISLFPGPLDAAKKCLLPCSNFGDHFFWAWPSAWGDYDVYGNSAEEQCVSAPASKRQVRTSQFLESRPNRTMGVSSSIRSEYR